MFQAANSGSVAAYETVTKEAVLLPSLGDSITERIFTEHCSSTYSVISGTMQASVAYLSRTLKLATPSRVELKSNIAM